MGTVGELLKQLEQFSIMGFLLFMIIVIALLTLVWIQTRKDSLDLRWLILDDVTARPSLHKLGQLFALMVSTWGFIILVQRNLLTEMYFTLYMGIWAGTVAVNKFLDERAPPGTTTVQQTTVTQTKEAPGVQVTDVIQQGPDPAGGTEGPGPGGSVRSQ